MNNERFGQNLVQQRYRCFKKQSDAAVAFGISQSSLSSYERGTIPSRTTLNNIAFTLGIEPEELFRGTGLKLKRLYDMRNIPRITKAESRLRADIVSILECLDMDELVRVRKWVIENTSVRKYEEEVENEERTGEEPDE